MNPDYVYRLADKEWNEFLAMLEQPEQDKPKLRLLMSRKAPWDDEE